MDRRCKEPLGHAIHRDAELATAVLDHVLDQADDAVHTVLYFEVLKYIVGDEVVAIGPEDESDDVPGIGIVLRLLDELREAIPAMEQQLSASRAASLKNDQPGNTALQGERP